MEVRRLIRQKFASTAFIILILFILFILTLFIPFRLNKNTYLLTIVLRVYRDGVVQVEYTVKSDITYPSINIMLFGNIFEAVIVVNRDATPREGIVDIHKIAVRI